MAHALIRYSRNMASVALAATALGACQFEWPMAPDVRQSDATDAQTSTQPDTPEPVKDTGPPSTKDSGPPSTKDAPQNTVAVDVTQSADMINRNPDQFPPVYGHLTIGNGTGGSLVLRVRSLLPTVQLDCAVVALGPTQWLSRALFAPAQVWQVASGRAIAPAQQVKSTACTAFLVDGSGVPMRLLFWHNADYPLQKLPSTVKGSQSGKMLLFASAGEVSGFAQHPVIYAPPPLQVPIQTPGCATGDAGTGIEWTLPLPSGELTVLDLASAPNGCHFMQLLSKTGMTSWAVCLPLGAMPFEIGDDFYASPLQGGHNLQPVVGVDLLGDGKRLRVGRGQDVVYFGKGTGKLVNLQGCPVSHDECGSALLPVAVQVDLGTKPTSLPAGAALPVTAGKLFVARAFDAPVANSACAGGPKVGRHIESVYAEGVQ